MASLLNATPGNFHNADNTLTETQNSIRREKGYGTGNQNPELDEGENHPSQLGCLSTEEAIQEQEMEVEGTIQYETIDPTQTRTQSLRFVDAGRV